MEINFLIKKSKNIIPQNILIGKLIGREGRNIKPIVERTGTHIHIDTNKIPAQIRIYVNSKKEIPPFENRINDASSQLNDLINKISIQENKKVDYDEKGKKKEKKKKDKKVLKKVESERPSKEVQHKSQELKKTTTKIVVNKVAKVTNVAVVNDNLLENFQIFKKFQKKTLQK